VIITSMTHEIISRPQYAIEKHGESVLEDMKTYFADLEPDSPKDHALSDFAEFLIRSSSAKERVILKSEEVEEPVYQESIKKLEESTRDLRKPVNPTDESERIRRGAVLRTAHQLQRMERAMTRHKHKDPKRRLIAA